MTSRRRRRTSRSRSARRPPDLDALSERELLGTRLCDLGLRLAGSPLEARVQALYRELGARGLVLRPHAWLSTDWFSPDGVPGFAIPFYLAHPRLAALEDKYMHEVEGGTELWFRQLLRHEAGHCLDSAYLLHERPEWRALFGSFDAPYRHRYQPRRYSKNFVRYLPNYYAQSHPAEDFAETVAVWLDPRSKWRVRYRNWPVYRKLLYVNDLMREIARVRPKVRRRVEIEPLSKLTLTLREYYEEKRRRYRLHLHRVYERDLARLFRARREQRDAPAAANYLRDARPVIRELVADRTGAHRYVIDRMISELIRRSADLDLLAPRRTERARQARRVATRIARYLQEGHATLAR